MHDNELPLGRRSRLYRVFEVFPAVLSLGLPLLLIVISFLDPLLAARLVVVLVALALLRGLRGGIDAIRGFRRLRQAERIDWGLLGAEAETVLRRARGLPVGLSAESGSAALPRRYRRIHADLLIDAEMDPSAYPLPSEIVHAVIVTAYNEPYGVVERSIKALSEAAIGPERLVVLLAYEARGGAAMRATAARLESEYGYLFRAFELVEHPAGLPDEIPGKGANLSYAGRYLQDWIEERGIDPRLVVVTSLDCDNRPHPRYFEAVSYEFVRACDRERVSFQPISLFVGNLWYAPAFARVIAVGNSLWNLISTVRPFSLRNFASHSQPMAALSAMGFWSRRTIVEDGHQYWRSYFHFHGRYRVVPVHLPISQDAVLAESLGRTLRTQFRQLARWAYGVSDVPFVGVRVLSDQRTVPFWRSLLRFGLLVDSHVSLASVAPLIAFGLWIPFIVAHGMLWLQAEFPLAVWRTPMYVTPRERAALSDFVEGLPVLAEIVQRVTIPGLAIMVVLSLLLLPPRPPELHRSRTLGMLAQWLLLPFTAVFYNALASVSSQTRLAVGLYRERFEVTEKAVPRRLGARPPVPPAGHRSG